MRIRPFFWCLLAFSCIGVLIFAATMRTQAPAIMRLHLDQQPPVAGGVTTIELHLTDSQGLPIEQAQVSHSAKMTNMDMVSNHFRIEPLGHGTYLAQLQLYMAGPWKISIEAHADGFEPLAQTLIVQVE